MATEIIIKNATSYVVNNGKGVYDSFKNSPIAFVFKAFTGLLSVNGILIKDITSENTFILIDDTPHKIQFETLGSKWQIPTPIIKPKSPYLAKYTYNNETYIVVFGNIDASGLPINKTGTCGSDITLSINDSASIPPYLYGCRLEGKPTRSDCVSVVTNYNLGGSLVPGQVPMQ